MKLLNNPFAAFRSRLWRLSIPQEILKMIVILLAILKINICQDFSLGLTTNSVNQFANYQIFM